MSAADLGAALPALLGGLLLLLLGAEVLVKGSVELGAALGLSPLFIGLTVVAFGTSAPELMVSLVAALRASPDIAAGNVIGSNIFNLGMVLGIAAVISPIASPARLVQRDLSLSIVATLLVGGFGLSGLLSRVEAGILVAGLVTYLVWTYRTGRAGASEPGTDPQLPGPTFAGGRTGWRPAALSGLLAIGGLVVLLLGARLLVNAAVEIAELAELSETVVGLTIVAAGTSLPELATSAVASFRDEQEIAVGNIMGSNLFNLLAILGITGLVEPLRIAPHLPRYDIPVLLGFSLACAPMMLTGWRLSRWEGGLLVSAYVGYSVWLVISRMG